MEFAEMQSLYLAPISNGGHENAIDVVSDEDFLPCHSTLKLLSVCSVFDEAGISFAVWIVI